MQKQVLVYYCKLKDCLTEKAKLVGTASDCLGSQNDSYIKHLLPINARKETKDLRWTLPNLDYL